MSGSQVQSGSPHRGSACVALGVEWPRAAAVPACHGGRCLADTGVGKQIGFGLWDRDGDFCVLMFLR